MPEAFKEINAVRAVDTQVTTLFSAKVTPATVLKRLRDHPFAHIVSHGILEPGKPFEASFKLHKGKRLQLLDIVRSELPRRRVCLPVCLSHGRADRREYCGRGAPSCCGHAVLRIPERGRDDVGYSRYGWAGPG